MKTLITFLLLLPLITGCATPSQIMLDAEVKRLCAIDGGIKVYETVGLPAAKFAEYKYGSVPIPLRENLSPRDDFYYKNTIQYLRQSGRSEDGGIDLLRFHYELYRAHDSKLLGESISYVRRGGDVSGPWHPSNFTCPELKELNLYERVFFIQQGDQ